MRVEGQPYQTIWQSADDPSVVELIDQRVLPHRFEIARLESYRQGVEAIRDMWVRGAPLIGATAAWSLYLATLEAKFRSDPLGFVTQAGEDLRAARPTAVNLNWAVDRVMAVLSEANSDQYADVAQREAEAILREDVTMCSQIGDHGLAIFQDLQRTMSGDSLNVLTHCNAGWLATVDWGTATAPMYKAHQQGLPLHVWVDETRPRNQGAYLTAWELAQEGVSHDIVVDNAGGHLMQQGLVDVVIVGTDRTASNGDVANKIGTYLKALAAKDNGVPFYVAAPSHSIDWNMLSGDQIPIEERDPREVTHVSGVTDSGYQEVLIANCNSAARNPSFDVTPARLVTGLVTERGVCAASTAGLKTLFPEKFG